MSDGDSNRITREYFESILIETRHIDACVPDLSVRYFGESFSMPIATAALSHLNNASENGMRDMAEGARLAGALCFSGMAERDELEAMCGTGAKVVKIIKPHADNAAEQGYHTCFKKKFAQYNAFLAAKGFQQTYLSRSLTDSYEKHIHNSYAANNEHY